MSSSEPIPTKQDKQAGFELDRIRLCFRNAALERVFLKDTLHQSVNFIRAYLIAGFFLYAAFAILDLVLQDPALNAILAIRFVVVCPFLIGIFILTFFPIFYRIAQWALAGVMLIAGLGIVTMTALMGPPFNSQYYAGLILVIVYSSSLSRLKFLHALLISIFMILCYQIVCLLINPIPMDAYISNNFFLVVAMGLGLFSAYLVELYIRRAYVGQQIVEEKNKQVSVALAEAVRANKSKSEFLATMSHELRTPLNAIIGFSDIIERQLFGPLNNDKYTDYARDIHDSGSHLLSIINDILDLAKAESGKMTLNEHDFDVTEMLEACVRMCKGRAEANKVALIFFGGQSKIRAVADQRLLLQIVANLLTNSIKFTPEGGSVKLYVSASRQKGIIIKVTDTGIGIAPENLERVLRPFEQVESSYARNHTGSGLGLPYAKRLTELHGGELKLESELGKGTTVTVMLPPSRVVEITMACPPLKEAM
jgi:two-component system, cell cycle sensor histidine kinase PleC